MRYLLEEDFCDMLKKVDGKDDPADWPAEMWVWGDCEGGGSEYGFSSQEEAFQDAQDSLLGDEIELDYRREVYRLEKEKGSKEYTETGDFIFYRSQQGKLIAE